MTAKIEISHKTIIFTLVLLASIWLVLTIKNIIFLLLVSFILMSALRPLVESLERYRIPRVISIFCIYILVFGLFGTVVGGLIPIVVSQTTKLISQLPKIVEIIRPYYQLDINSLSQQIAPISQNVLQVTVGVFSNIATILTILILTFYLLLERRYFDDRIIDAFGKPRGEKIVSALKHVEYALGTWVRGEFILMLCIGLLSFIGLSLLRVEYAVPLAILAGALEIVPVIGPIFSAIPAVLVALTVSPLFGLTIVALYFVIHQTENTIVVPQVMKRAVGLSPLITILAILIGSDLAGLLGGVLAIPIVIALREIIKDTVNSSAVKS